jgi:hypothetical protein
MVLLGHLYIRTLVVAPLFLLWGLYHKTFLVHIIFLMQKTSVFV